MNEHDQALIDDEHLRLLRLGYFVSAGTTGLFSAFGLLYMGMGLVFSQVIEHSPHSAAHPPPPEAFKWFFVGIGFAMFTVATTVAILKLRAALYLRLRETFFFCRVVAAISCLTT